MFRAITVHEAYKKMIRDVLYEWEYQSNPRGLNTKEILNYQIKILKPILEPIVTSDEKRNSVLSDYTKKELDWYLSGNREADSAPAKFWQSIADSDGNINSNYGDLILFDKSENGVTPYRWALDCLKQDMFSRKAMMRYNKSKHCDPESKDFVCTLGQTFHIRDDKLHSSVTMRSSDIFTGVPYDLPWFIFLQEKMLKDLKPVYSDLEMGSMTFFTHSLHAYERNWKRLEGMI